MGRKEENTKKILDAAIIEFLDKGMNSATMEGIASGAGLTRRTLYKYFPQKELIFDAIVERLLTLFETTMPQLIYSSDKEIKNQIFEVASSKVELMCSEEYIHIAKLVIGELLKSKKIKEEFLIKFSKIEANFNNWIDEAREDGKIISELPTELISNQFHSILKGQIHYPVLLGMVEPSEELKEMTKKMSVDFFIKNFC